MKTILRVTAIGLALMLMTIAAAADNSPETLVKSTVDDVLAVIKQNKNKRALHELAEQKVVPHFDFSRMTQLAVGAGWRQANPTQQQALEHGFRTLLIDTYTTALSVAATGNETVEVKPAQAKTDHDEVMVKTLVKERGKDPIAIDYRMANSAGGWKVFDVVVENLSLVTNYRSTFASEINRSGIDGLIKVLDEKNRANAANSKS